MHLLVSASTQKYTYPLWTPDSTPLPASVALSETPTKRSSVVPGWRDASETAGVMTLPPVSAGGVPS